MTNYKNAKYNFDGSNLTGVTFNDDNLQEKIAMTNFRVQANGSLSKYQLKDMAIDTFQDETGVDAGNSTDYMISDEAIKGSASSGLYDFRVPTSSTCRTSSPNMRAGNGTWDGNMNDSWTSGEDTWDSQSYVNGWFKGYWNTAYAMEQSGIKQSGSCTGNYKIEASNDDSTWVLQHTGTNNASFQGTYGNTQTWTATGEFNYWRLWITSHSGNTSVNDMTNCGFFTAAMVSGNDFAVQSTAKTAEASPTTADVILAYKNTAGTATLNTDLKGYVSRDGGTTWILGTLVAEGDFDATRKLAAFHDLDFTGAAGTDLRWKLTTHNQNPATFETEVHAVSLGWK